MKRSHGENWTAKRPASLSNPTLPSLRPLFLLTFSDNKTHTRSAQADFYISTDFRVLHEDASYLVVDKPAPLPVHPVGSYGEMNLHSILKRDSRWVDTKIHLVHRLDSETSGVLLIAKTPEAARFAGIEFLKGRVKKKYHALVFGIPKEKEGEIALPLGNDPGSGFQTVRTVDFENGEAALTRYRVLEICGEYSRLEIEPMTGRTHQIRAHLSFIGHPVVGDKIYIDLEIFRRYVLNGLDAEMLSRLKLRRLALHATSLTLRHPENLNEVTYRSEPPNFLKDMDAKS